MRRLSPETSYLITSLYSAPSLWERLTGRIDRVEESLAQIAVSGEAAAIPWLVRLLFDKDPRVARRASDTIHKLLQNLPNEELPWLDEQIRSWETWSEGRRWDRLQPEDLQSPPGTEESRMSMLGLLTCHPRGRVREEAIRQIGNRADRAGLPFLLVRLNDWVAPVRQAALAVTERWLREGPFDPFVANLSLILRLEDCQRGGHAQILQEVLRRFLMPQYEPILLELVRTGRGLVGRRAFAVAVGLPGSHIPRLIQAGLASRDTMVRLRAAQHVSPLLSGDERDAALALMWQDPFMPVRREALLAQIQLFPDTQVEVLREALLDRSPSLREWARFCLKKLGPFDFAGFYRETLRETRATAISLRGLGETGTGADAEVVEPYLHSSTVSVRKAAVEALAMLAGDEHLETFLGYLRDDSPKVAKTAAKWLAGRARLLDLEQVMAVFSTDDRPHVRMALLFLLDDVERWQALPFLIAASADRDRNVAARARKHIERLYNRIFTRPSEGQVQRIQDALEEHRRRLDLSFATRFRDWLRGLGITG